MAQIARLTRDVRPENTLRRLAQLLRIPCAKCANQGNSKTTSLSVPRKETGAPNTLSVWLVSGQKLSARQPQTRNVRIVLLELSGKLPLQTKRLWRTAASVRHTRYVWRASGLKPKARQPQIRFVKCVLIPLLPLVLTRECARPSTMNVATTTPTAVLALGVCDKTNIILSVCA